MRITKISEGRPFSIHSIIYCTVIKSIQSSANLLDTEFVTPRETQYMDHNQEYITVTKKMCRKKKRVHDLKVLEDIRKHIREMKQENSIQWLMG